MARIEKFEELNCWKAARELTGQVYRLKGKLETDFELRDQLRRAAISVMNNIAEGFGRFSQKEKIRFLEIAQSSANEVKSMLYLMSDLNYIDSELRLEPYSKTEVCQRQIWGLIKYLRSQ